VKTGVIVTVTYFTVDNN